MMSFNFDLKLTVVKTACMHAIVATYVRTSTWYLTRGQLAIDNINLQLLDIGITELSRQTTTVEKMIVE